MSQTTQLTAALASLLAAATKAADPNVPQRKEMPTIKFEGREIVLPADPNDMTPAEAKKWLTKYEEAELMKVVVTETITGFPSDVAYNLFQSLRETFGFISIEATPGLFGPRPPAYQTITLSDGTSVEIPWGQIEVPGLGGTIQIHPADTKTPGLVVVFNIIQKFRPLAQTILANLRARMATHSIYKGQAIVPNFSYIDDESEFNPSEHSPRFITPTGITRDSLVLNNDVEEQVEAFLFTPIRHRDALKSAGIPFKRTVCLSGPPGTGKTLTARVTAHLALQHGITFVHCENPNWFTHCYKLAALLAPAVVFMEDMDRITSGKRDVSIDAILNTVDGIEFKRADILLVVTTNDEEAIIGPMARPGRIDSFIPMLPFDSQAAAIITHRICGPALSDPENLPDISSHLAGKIPAALEEICKRAKLYTIMRTGESGSITCADIRASAIGMDHHMKLVNKPRATTPPISHFNTTDLRDLIEATRTGCQMAYLETATNSNQSALST